MLDYHVQAGDKSMYNTPPCWAIYMCGLMFAKMRRDGGLMAMQQANEKVTLDRALDQCLDSVGV